MNLELIKKYFTLCKYFCVEVYLNINKKLGRAKSKSAPGGFGAARTEKKCWVSLRSTPTYKPGVPNFVGRTHRFTPTPRHRPVGATHASPLQMTNFGALTRKIFRPPTQGGLETRPPARSAGPRSGRPAGRPYQIGSRISLSDSPAGHPVRLTALNQFFPNLLRKPARPTSPEPRRSRAAGAGTGPADRARPMAVVLPGPLAAA